MMEIFPFAAPIYELIKLGSAENPLVLASSARVPDGNSFEALKDVYFGLYEALIGQLVEILGEPAFNNGKGNRGYPRELAYEFVATWPLAGRTRFVGLKQDPKTRVCSLDLGVTG